MHSMYKTCTILYVLDGGFNLQQVILFTRIHKLGISITSLFHGNLSMSSDCIVKVIWLEGIFVLFGTSMFYNFRKKLHFQWLILHKGDVRLINWDR